MASDSQQEAAVLVAAALLEERAQKQAILVTKFLFEEWKQFQYFSLGSAPPLTLPDDPQSADIYP